MTIINNNVARFSGTGNPALQPDEGNQQSSLSSLFTTLLIAQLQNQDPLAPMEASQFVTQFAQMSQVEASQKLEQWSALMAGMQESTLVVTLGSQVGSEVMVHTDTVEMGTEPVRGGLTLESSAAEVTVTLTGPDGEEHDISLGAQQAGPVDFEIDPTEHGLEPGPYKASIKTDTGETPAMEVAGELQSVRFGANGRVILSVAGVGDVEVADITRFLGRQNGPKPSEPTPRRTFFS